MRKINVHGVEYHVADQGSGPPILFVHGFPLDHTMWRPQLDVFSDSYRTIAPDLRGFGGSGVTPGTVTMEQFADDLIALLDAMQVMEPITFCGLSMGGYIAWQFARKQPQRLKALILCDTRAVADTPEAAENRHKLAASVLEHGPEVVAKAMLPKLFASKTGEPHPTTVDSLREVMLRTNPEGIAAALRGMAQRPDVTDLLPSIRCPALALVGEEDQISPPDEMQKIADALPNARFRTIPHAGHMAPVENPEAVNAAIREFLQSL